LEKPVLKTYQYPKFTYQRPPELSLGENRMTKRFPVIVVGAGPVGLACAIDLKQQGIDCLLIDEDDTVSIGSRGVCYAKRTLEIFDRLNMGNDVVNRGVSWQRGRTFFRNDEVYHFNLLAESGHERPAMINLQQYHLEEILQRRAAQAQVDMRWRQKVIAVDHPSVDVGTHTRTVQLQVESPDGVYELSCDWLVVADGARSSIRRMMGLDVEGKVFTDRFLIADVVMQADFPSERWFWFDPPFHRNQSVLLHRQADKVWRIDFQLGWDADPEEEKKPERVIPRIQAMLGEEHRFELEWVSVYTFQCRRMLSFRHGPVLFVGDAAHQVSPFGARGANSGIQDADNLAWKLARVVKCQSPDRLLDSYNQERVCAADENILNSTRSTDFITPKSSVSRVFRNATLDLANHFPFARSMVNSGRLSLPTHYLDSLLNTADLPSDHFACALYPGSPMCDAPIMVNGQSSWLLRNFNGRFVLLFVKGDEVSDQVVNSEAMKRWIESANIHLIAIDLLQQPRASNDQDPWIKTRLDLQPGNCWLMRPDQHLAARFRKAALDPLMKAFERATAQIEQPAASTRDVAPEQAVAPISGSLTGALRIEPNFKDFDTPVLRDYQGNDRFYDMLINAHRNLSDDASSALNARLLLLLANHIGDVSVLQQAIEAAKAIQTSTSYKE
jgi:3-(3-hydroxy-phenyl)propionate hydroxylase